MNAIISFLIENRPMFVAIIITAFVVWKARGYYYILKKTESKVENLPCDSHKERLENISAQYSKTVEDLPCDSHKEKLENISVQYSKKVENLPCDLHKEKLENISAQYLKTVENLPCDSHKEKLDNISAQCSKIDEVMLSMNDKLTEVCSWVMKKDRAMIKPLSKVARKVSPLKLTSAGEILLRESGAKKAIDENIDFFMNELGKLSPKIAYDVEDYSLKVLLNNTGKDIFNCVKDFIYYSPSSIDIKEPDSEDKINIELSLSLILSIMSIYLRDRYFENYPGIINELPPA